MIRAVSHHLMFDGIPFNDLGFYALADFIPSVTGRDDAVDAASGLGTAGRLDVSLGRYGQERPGEVSLVIEGAERTFVAIGRWMDVRHWCAGP